MRRTKKLAAAAALAESLGVAFPADDRGDVYRALTKRCYYWHPDTGTWRSNEFSLPSVSVLESLFRRLAQVRGRILMHEKTDIEQNVNSYVSSAGALVELRDEQLFLAGLIERIEQVSA